MNEKYFNLMRVSAAILLLNVGSLAYAANAIPDDLKSIKLMTTPETVAQANALKGSLDIAECSSAAFKAFLDRKKNEFGESSPRYMQLEKTRPFGCSVKLTDGDKETYRSISMSFRFTKTGFFLETIEAAFNPKVISPALKDKLIAKYGTPTKVGKGAGMVNMEWEDEKTIVGAESRGHLRLEAKYFKKMAQSESAAQDAVATKAALGPGDHKSLLGVQLFDSKIISGGNPQITNSQWRVIGCGKSAFDKTKARVNSCNVAFKDTVLTSGKVFYFADAGLLGYDLEFNWTKTFSGLEQAFKDKFGTNYATTFTHKKGGEFFLETNWDLADGTVTVTSILPYTDPMTKSMEKGTAWKTPTKGGPPAGAKLSHIAFVAKELEKRAKDDIQAGKDAQNAAGKKADL